MYFCCYLLSGSDVPGEGEIKAIHYIRTHEFPPHHTFLIIGSDADIILQGVLHVSPIVLSSHPEALVQPEKILVKSCEQFKVNFYDPSKLRDTFRYLFPSANALEVCFLLLSFLFFLDCSRLTSRLPLILL
jgi:hypothetical protein